MVLDEKEILKRFGVIPVLNRTFCYLFPSLAIENMEIFSRLHSLKSSVLGVFLFDENFRDDDILDEEPAIFVVLDITIQPLMVFHHLEYIRKQEQFITDYPYKGESKYIILILRTDFVAYKNFLEGKYSEMYEKDVLHKIPFPVNRELAVDIFRKTPQARNTLTEIINQTFETTLSVKELEKDVECELPPIYSQATKFFETITLK